MTSIGVMYFPTFQNCLLASLPPTRWRTTNSVRSYRYTHVIAALLTLLATRMLLLELGQIVDILINDDPEVGGLVVRCYVACLECFCHLGKQETGTIGGDAD